MKGKSNVRKSKAQSKQAAKFKQQLRKHNELASDDDTKVPQTAIARKTFDDRHTSVLFEPYRAFGNYTSSVPFCVYKSSEDTLLATVVGKNAFYVYSTAKLGIIFMSRFIAEEITYLQAAATGLIYTSLRETNEIVTWNKMHRHAVYSGHEQQILQFLVTTNLIFSLAEEGEFLTFNTQSGKVVKRVQFENKDLTGIIHPVTYVNKMLFYGGNKMELWNVIEHERVYEFTMDSPIETVVQSPVVDIVAVGCQNGSIHLVNLLYDEILFTFSHKEGSVSSISFLSDSSLGLSLMASTSLDVGSIVLWDLNARKIMAELTTPHSGKDISHLAFIANEPILISASEDDNSLKMWQFEKGQLKPRLLRERSGHAEAPHMIRFYGGLDDP